MNNGNKKTHAENMMIGSVNYARNRDLVCPLLLLMSLRFGEHHRDNRMWAERPLLTVWAGGGM